MPFKAELNTYRGPIVFSSGERLIQGLTPSFSDIPNAEGSLKEMVREARRLRRPDVTRIIGEVMVSLKKGPGLLGKYTADIYKGDGEGERAEAFEESIIQRTNAERAVTSCQAEIAINNEQEAVAVLSNVFKVLPIEKEINIPDDYINPRPIRPLTNKGKIGNRVKVQLPSRFNIVKNGDLSSYAHAMMEEGRSSMYRTNHDLVVFVSAEKDKNENMILYVALMKFKNPIIAGQSNPFTARESEFAEKRLNMLKANLAAR